jgi:hypothetical protein
MLPAFTVGDFFAVCEWRGMLCVVSPAGWKIYDKMHTVHAKGDATGDDGKVDALNAVRKATK